ncbi:MULTISPECIES: AI-2E family transporter [Methylobacterium]|uniref:Transport protein YdiK n=1 Tax=Methylobacterium jeotgali TaxID=381630 RepID=A0ABQ4STQ5_9HYPH|nr:MULTISPECIES: AI-2E family transporter [Methylobacterium]PIU05592.1 MAG: AI-2E family transporter [Methylobacterium sp. CG09_land_8_20_14_0_10_71_15]PIU14767.1 MAG: AI-2E family transporter [Methylobacterium sp. CG08_land_8_20_14_0_20_71_15]GBU18418.1 AI-2E family transporter [Methylobacterium sp.]GJE05833.1 Putative transport protein YdiK [Methylobacterium jeotgali]
MDTIPRPVITPADPPRARGQGVARVLLVVALAALGLWILRAFLPALAWALILAIALGPLYARAERRWPPGRHNVLLPALFTLAVALVFLAPLALLAVQAAREAHDVLELARGLERDGLPVPDVLTRLPFLSAQAVAWWQANLAHPAAGSELLHRFDNGSVIDLSRNLGKQIVHRSVLFGFCLVALFFLFREREALAAQALVAADRLFGPRGERVGRQMVASVHGTVDGLVLVGLGEGAILGVVYFFAGVPHPVLLGALTAVAATIPFGAPLVFGLAAVLLLAAGSTGAAIVVVAAGIVVTFVADHFVRPALIGGTTKLPFLWVLLGILGGVESFGLLGLFLGPAVMAALVLLWRDFTGATREPA